MEADLLPLRLPPLFERFEAVLAAAGSTEFESFKGLGAGLPPVTGSTPLPVRTTSTGPWTSGVKFLEDSMDLFSTRVLGTTPGPVGKGRKRSRALSMPPFPAA
jgi:hypothetical protein